VHILVDQDATVSRRITLSRCAETLRRKAEAIQLREDA